MFEYAEETREAWVDDGARDMAQWTSMQLDVSRWKAERWLHAGTSSNGSPRRPAPWSVGTSASTRSSSSRGSLISTTRTLVAWAREVPSGAIRRAAELRAKEGTTSAASHDESRWLAWRYVDDGRRFVLDAELPTAQGAVVARALDRLGGQIPVIPGEGSPYAAGSRRADALVALCSARLAGDADQDRATIVVHADLETLHGADSNAVFEGGPVIAGTTLQRLLCNARVQAVVEHPDGSVAPLGRMSREPSASMMRQLRHRDDTCRFPGWDARRFTQAHHIRWWLRGGPSELDNLVLTCSFHHKLVHEHGWSIHRDDDGDIAWHRPSGVRYRAGLAEEAV